MAAHPRTHSSPVLFTLRRLLLLAALVALTVVGWPASSPQAASADPCAPPNGNPIKCENALTGNPSEEWDISGAGDETIQGFATDISVNHGQTVHFKIDTNARAYTIDIYRLGYYGGLGARKVGSVTPSAHLPQSQPDCISDLSTGLLDCGNWGESASWAVPSTAVSGIYVAKLTRTDTQGASHIVFIVRDDSSHSDVLFQTADPTWQAYNDYGGNSLYVGDPAGRAYKVSYNRPFVTRDQFSGLGISNWVFWAEYPMLRFMEANGYDMSYASGIDTDRSGARLLNHHLFVSAGHDEYWSAAQRAAVETAVNSGVHMASFGGNFVYWKTRYESSIDGANTPYRTLVCYKETLDGQKIDPASEWTGTWRDPSFSPPADGGRPENSLVGTIFTVNSGPNGLAGTAIQVPQAMGRARLWRYTNVATLGAGQTATLAAGTLGYEWDEDLDNGSRPGGLIRLSSTTENVPDKLYKGYGSYSDFGPATATHSITLHRKASGALVFSAATVQWAWGLDEMHDGFESTADTRMQQATVNQFADMGIQPTTLLSTLHATTASVDVTPPTATITSPVGSQQVISGTQLTIVGTASDVGGMVGGVEVSVDGGTTWHPAAGTTAWSYKWTPPTLGPYTISVRATDDSANIQSALTTVSISAKLPPCPCSFWNGSTVPETADSADSSSLEIGVRFTASVDGTISGLRFYKSAANTGTHLAHLWSASGTMLATAQFSGESASGWQSVSFAAPVAITAGTTYVASYFAPNGHYGADSHFFDSAFVNGLLRAPGASEGGNGVFYYGSSSGFPTESYNATNYWVDVIFNNSADSPAPTVTSQSPAPGAGNVIVTTPVTATFNKGLASNTVNASTFQLRNASNQLVASTVSYDLASKSAVLTPASVLSANTSYTARLVGGSAGIQDPLGTALASDVTWTFSTGAIDATAPTVTSVAPVNASVAPVTTTVMASFSEGILPSSLTSATFTLKDSSSQAVAATVTYDANTQLASLVPTTSLHYGVTYTARLVGGSSGVKDLSSNPLAADDVWTFTTQAAPACPCSFWNPLLTTPTVPDSGDESAVEVGLKFQSSADGFITGLRFYKSAGNTGTHMANLWSSDGSLLASTPFVAETASGWQQVTFGAAVPVQAGVTYVASYFAPNGHYAAQGAFFGSALGVGPLTGPSGTNGVFRYNSSSVFPTSSFNSTNYWVDVIFENGTGGGSLSVVTTNPAAGAVGVSPAVTAQMVFNKALSVASVNASTIQLRDASDHAVPATVSYDPVTFTASVDPVSTLAFNAQYTLRVAGGASGVKDVLGNPLLMDVTSSFSTGLAPACPCALWSYSATPSVVDSADGNPFEVGTRFQPQIDGYVTSIRFYKATANTGSHSVSLWASDGTLLANVQSTSETASGWQEVSLPSPVNVSAGNVYVASYWAPVGHYSFDSGYFTGQGLTNGPLHALGSVEGANGVFRSGSTGFPADSYGAANYWVTPVFMASGVPDAVPPAVTSTAPAEGSTVPVTTMAMAEFSEGILSASITGGNFQLRAADGQLVSASVSYDPVTRLAVLQPLQGLRFAMTYTAKIVGGASGVKDLAGNPLAADHLWTFTTETAPNCPCTLWDGATVVPATPDSGDQAALELGVRFTPSAEGVITGVRFYKSDANTGEHVASLWTSTGVLLASTVFVNESPSGWQQVSFATPVPVQAGVTYVASYFAPNGHYGFQSAYFASPVIRGPLTAPSGANGVFHYGSTGFPSDSFNSANYWVDLVFQPYSQPLAVTGISVAPSASGANIAWATNVAADSVVEYGLTSGYGQTVSVATLGTSHSVSLTGLTANAIYHFRVRSRDAAGRIDVSGDATFNTDVTSPLVSAVQVSGLTGTAATVSWTTNEVSDSQVEYGTTVSYGSTSALNATLSTSHTVALSGLLANTTYHYRIRTRDAAGNLGVSADATFNTDIIPPVVSAVAVTSITSTGGTIGWTTNEPADTQVEYGLTTSYGSTSPLQAALASSHSVVLSSLQTNRTYHFRIRTKDARGNLTVTPDFAFATDGTAPTISAVTAVPGQTSFTITWTTDEPADTQADYGTSSSYGSSSTLQAALVTTHTVTITGLQTNRTYNYRVKSRDAAGNLRTSSNFTVVTDATAPTISSVQANETATSATVTWSTNESSDSQVEYGLTTSYGSSSVLAPALVSSHSVVLSGLQANKAYHFRVKSRDAAGNLATSSDFTLSTDVTAPTISAVASVANQSGAAITWTTNESSDTQVEYGTTTSYGSTSSLQSSLVTSHSAALSGLQGNRTYHFRVRSRDAAGNLAVSGDFTFATDSTAPTISNITETRVSSTSERINWTTNEASDTQIQYGTSQSNLNQSTTLVTTMTTAHNQTLTGLQSNRTYYYRVMSRDAAGNLATSATGSFATN